jgi:hypothetical protein
MISLIMNHDLLSRSHLRDHFRQFLVLFYNSLNLMMPPGILLKLLAIKISVVRCHAMLGIAMEMCALGFSCCLSSDPAPSVHLYRIRHFSHLTLLSIKLSVHLTYFKREIL